MKEDTMNLTEAAATATKLVEDLRLVIKTDNPLLADLVTGLLESSMKIEQNLKRLVVISE